MGYNEIVDELNKKIKYYQEDFIYTKEYFAINFYENNRNVSMKNMDTIRYSELLAIALAKKDMLTKDLLRLIFSLDCISSMAISSLIHEALKGSPSITLGFKIGGDYLSEEDILEDSIKLFKTIKKLFKDYEVKSFFSEFDDFSKNNSEIRQEEGRIRNVVYTKAADELYGKFKKYLDYAYSVSNGLTIKKIDSIASKYINALTKFEEANEMGNMLYCLDSISAIDDNELKKKIYMYINNFHMPKYLEIEQEYEEKNKNTLYAYIEFFKTYGLDFSKLDSNFQNKIMEDSIDIIKTKISIISSFIDNKDYFAILASSSIESLVYIEKCIKDGFLEKSFVIMNKSIIVNSNKFDIFKTNLELLLEKVNMKKYCDKSFLLGDTEMIRKNIALLDKYSIPYKNCLDLSFITEDIKPKLSVFVEVGLENEIYSNPDILNVDIDLAKRVILTKMVDGDINEGDGLSSLVINPDMFFVPASKVNIELQRDNTTYNRDGFLYLPKVESTPLSYNVDGVIIPKIRVEEQPVSLESIIRPSLYSKEEIKILEKNATK